MASCAKLLDRVQRVLAERYFSPTQIAKLIPRLHEGFFKEPRYLAEVVDTWNSIMTTVNPFVEQHPGSQPALARAPPNSLLGTQDICMSDILADIEPDLLLLDPDKLKKRHRRIQGLGMAKNLGEYWLMLYYAPRGFYLQDWVELSKKIYYIENQVINFLYDKKEQKTIQINPIIKSAAVIEEDFDHIRTRYLFALRSGYKSLGHMFDVQKALDKPTLADLLLADDEDFMRLFAPFCSYEEYKTFSDLIKRHSFDDDDAQIYERLAELNSLSHEN